MEVAGIEIVWLVISLCNTKTLLFGVCSQPPNYNVMQKQKFTDGLNIPTNALFQDASKLVLLAGDRSMDKSLHCSLNGQNHFTNNLNYFVSSHGFDQLNQLMATPTRNSRNLDWFAIKDISLVLDSGFLPPLNNLDHSLIFTTLSCLLPNSPSSSKSLWNYANADFTNLNEALLADTLENTVANSSTSIYL